MPAPVLDGTATGIAATTTTVAAALTTTATNDIICALVYIEQPAGNIWVTGISGGGLTWQNRNRAAQFPAQTLELWWAVAPTALSGVTITATSSGTFDGAAMLVFGVSGCNTTNPWDANTSLAAKLFNPLSGAPTFANISTTQANDFLILGWGSNGFTFNQGTVPTGFTLIGFRNSSPPSAYANVCAASLGVTAAQTNQTYAWGSNAGTAAIFDALTADTGGSTTAPRPTFEVLTHATGAGTNTRTVSLAGASANDVLVVLSYCENAGGGPAITGISGGGLTWVQRTRSHGSARGSLEIWYAPVTGTLAASTITITYAGNFDAASVIALAAVGCSSAVWDANVGLPASVSHLAGGSWTPSVTVTTTQAHDMVLVINASATNFSDMTSVPSGFAFLDQANIGGAAQFSSFGTGTQPRSTTKSSVATTWGASVNDSSGGEYVVDALTADGGSGGAGAAQARALIMA